MRQRGCEGNGKWRVGMDSRRIGWRVGWILVDLRGFGDVLLYRSEIYTVKSTSEIGLTWILISGDC